MPALIAVSGKRLSLRREVRGSVVLVEAGAESEAPSVLEIHRRVLTEGDFFITEADEFRKTRAWKAAAIRELVAGQNSCFLVARLDGELVGALMARGGHLRRSRHVARVEIFVDQPFRGRGVGRLLMDAVVFWARTNADVEKLSLTVFADNMRAIRLY